MTFRDFGDSLKRLWRGGPANNLVVVDRTPSTNTLGRAYAERFFEDADVPPTTFLIAREQTAGRGRGGARSWESKPGHGAYISVVHCLGESPKPEMLQSLPIVVGTTLCEALRAYTPEAKLKWPNDLFVQDRKLGGILIETCTSEDAEVAVVIGFGINLECPEADELHDKATSLRREVPQASPELPELILHLCSSMSGAIPSFGNMEAALGRYREVSMHRVGDRLACDLGQRKVEGIFKGFDDNGCLCIETEAGDVIVAAGEVILNHPAMS